MFQLILIGILSLLSNTKGYWGGPRSWTMDLSICSRMLYHWAIPPYISVDVYLQKTFCICMNILTEHLFKWLHEWTLTNVIKCWCLDFFCNSILYILKTKHNFGIMIIRFQWTRKLAFNWISIFIPVLLLL